MTVTRNDVQHIARLASLALDEQSLPELTRQIASIVDYVSRLETVDASGVSLEATSPSAGPLQPLRPDEPRKAELHSPISAFAPDFRDGLFLVPRLGAVGDASPDQQQ